MTTRSRAERSWERVLDAIAIGHEPSCKEFTPWELDFYLPEWHLALEIDGPWHGPKRDVRRDADLLERYGIPTLRLKTSELGNAQDRTEAVKRLHAFIERWAASTADRKRIWRSNSL